MKPILQLPLTLGAVALMGLVPPAVRDHVHAEPTYQPSEIESAKESIALSLLGQLQLSVGDLMWMKSMEYLHVGMVQRMPTRAEEARGFRRRDAVNAAAGLGHVEGVQLVLDQERDWRGLFGEIERHVKPYDTAHKHDDPVELIPWYELAVRLNPRLERLYTLGAFYLADFAHEPGEAREMLEAGLKANPNSFEIHGALGRLYVDFAERLGELAHHHDEEEGHEEEHDEDEEHHEEFEAKTPAEAYSRAVELLTRATELGKGYRDELLKRRELFDEFQNQVLGESYIYLSKALIGLGEFEKAVAASDEGWEEAQKYPQRNLLRVQNPIAEEALAGQSPDSIDLDSLERAGDTSKYQDTPGVVKKEGPVPVVLPIAPAIGAIAPGPEGRGAASDHEKSLLPELREHPYETAAQHAARLGISEAAARVALESLAARHFAATTAESADNAYRFYLTPPGLYVALGHYGFDFWDVMDQEVAQLRAQGVTVNWEPGIS